jgi:hypothetical protein
MISDINVVDLADGGLSIMLRENKVEVPFEINFRARAVENNASSCFFLFPDSAIHVTDAVVNRDRVSKLDIEFLDRPRKKMVIPAEETLLWAVLTRAPHLKVVICRTVGAKIT